MSLQVADNLVSLFQMPASRKSTEYDPSEFSSLWTEQSGSSCMHGESREGEVEGREQESVLGTWFICVASVRLVITGEPPGS